MSEKVGKRSEKVGKISEKVGKPSGKSIFSDNFPMFHPHDGNLQHWQCKFISYASDGIFPLWKWKLPTNLDFSDGFFLQCGRPIFSRGPLSFYINLCNHGECCKMCSVKNTSE
jgi:hypothetical protein